MVWRNMPDKPAKEMFAWLNTICNLKPMAMLCERFSKWTFKSGISSFSQMTPRLVVGLSAAGRKS